MDSMGATSSTMSGYNTRAASRRALLGGAKTLAAGACLAWLGGCGVGQGGSGAGGSKLAGKVDLIYVADPGEQELHERWAARLHELTPAVTVNLTLLKEDSEYVPKLVALAAS